jgi:hypothetical protein
MKKILSLVFLVLAYCSVKAQQTGIPASEAVHHIGKTVWVCDQITDSRMDNISKDEPTVLYCGSNYENRTLALIFTNEVLQGFSYEPSAKLINHHFCVHGKIVMYHGKPAIYIKGQGQLKVPQ